MIPEELFENFDFNSYHWFPVELVQVSASVAAIVLPGACCVAAMEHSEQCLKVWLYFTIKKPELTQCSTCDKNN